MGIFSMLQNATVFDAETDDVVGHTVGFEVINGRMRLKMVMLDEFVDDEDGGAEEPVPEEEGASIHIRAISGGRDSG